MALVYSAYGLRFEVNRPIPGLIPLNERPPVDVRVRLDELPPRSDEMLAALPEPWYVSDQRAQSGAAFLTTWKLSGGAYFRMLYQAGAGAQIEIIVDRAGTQIWANWSDSVPAEEAALCLQGPVMGFVLRLRGLLCLHASAVAVGDQALVLAGPAGSGKSTTAAAMARRGLAVLADDVVALREQDQVFLVQPAFPRLGLWPESVEALFGTPAGLPRLSARLDKRYLDLGHDSGRFQRQPLPLGAVYLLDPRSSDPAAPYLEPLSGHAAFISLAGNAYMRYLLDKEMRATEFGLLGQIGATLPLRRVTPHADPSKLSKLCDTILDDFESFQVTEQVM